MSVFLWHCRMSLNIFFIKTFSGLSNIRSRFRKYLINWNLCSLTWSLGVVIIGMKMNDHGQGFSVAKNINFLLRDGWIIQLELDLEYWLNLASLEIIAEGK